MDENRFTPDEIQRLVLGSCSSYARSTRAVNIVAPIYYADLIALRAKAHMVEKDGVKELRQAHQKLQEMSSMWWM